MLCQSSQVSLRRSVILSTWSVTELMPGVGGFDFLAPPPRPQPARRIEPSATPTYTRVNIGHDPSGLNHSRMHSPPPSKRYHVQKPTMNAKAHQVMTVVVRELICLT